MEQLQPRLVQELSPLRKGGGVTPIKLRDAHAIRSVAAHVTSTSVDTLTDNQVYSFLLSELSLLTHSDATAALKNAFGIGSPHKKLSTRRSLLAAKLTKHPDTIERYENQGIGNFAAQLTERSLHSQRKDASPLPPLYLQELEAQVKATRAMTAIGLSSHLSLGDHGKDLMRYLKTPRKPYINANVTISLLPSSRGTDWYSFRLSYSFQGGREGFRVAVVLNSTDGETLMANGLIDDYHRLDNPANPRRDTKTIIASSKFIIRNTRTNTQKLLRFRELQPKQIASVVESTSRPLLNSCWLLEVTVPAQWQTKECSYEYLSSINLQIASVAYWYSPTLMYLKKLTLNYSQFPEAHTRDFFILPFFGHKPGTVLSEKYTYVLDLNNWIMPGHGIVIGWQSLTNISTMPQ